MISALAEGKEGGRPIGTHQRNLYPVAKASDHFNKMKIAELKQASPSLALCQSEAAGVALQTVHVLYNPLPRPNGP